MAKGSVRKKGKKWYYRFYVEDASGNLVQKEFTGTESKSETEKLLRQAMEDYEEKKFIAKADNITLGELLDIWAEEELKVGTLSNGTVKKGLSKDFPQKSRPARRTLILEQAFLSFLLSGLLVRIELSGNNGGMALYLDFPLLLAAFCVPVAFIGEEEAEPLPLKTDKALLLSFLPPSLAAFCSAWYARCGQGSSVFLPEVVALHRRGAYPIQAGHSIGIIHR